LDKGSLLTNDEAEVSNASFVLPKSDGAKEVTIVLPDGTTARAILQPDVMASN